MFCRNCGAAVPEDAAFCEKCGTPIAEQEAEKIKEPRKKAGAAKKKTGFTGLSVIICDGGSFDIRRNPILGDIYPDKKHTDEEGRKIKMLSERK